MKYQFMKEQAKEFKVERMSQVFGVSSSGYYAYLKQKTSNRKKENNRLLDKIKEVYKSSRQTYGSPRIHAELKLKRESCSKKRVAKIMKAAGIAAKMKKKFKVTTKADPKAVPAVNLLNQNFTVSEPNRWWAADFSYVGTQEGWLYVAVVMDLFSRLVVGLFMSNRMNDDLVVNALKQALVRRCPSVGLVHHSDRGSQYTSQKMRDLLSYYGIVASQSGIGNCYDNAVVESFFHSLKTEHTCFEQYTTREQAKVSIFDYVEVFYNRQRRHSTLGYLSPLAFEQKQQERIFIPSLH
jgi:putative transposase